VAPMVAEEGTAEGLSRVGPRFPLMPEAQPFGLATLLTMPDGSSFIRVLEVPARQYS
jgi:hypothetical protein